MGADTHDKLRSNCTQGLEINKSEPGVVTKAHWATHEMLSPFPKRSFSPGRCGYDESSEWR